MKNTQNELLDTLATRGIVSFLGDLTDAYEVTFSDWIAKTKIAHEGSYALAFYRGGELTVAPRRPEEAGDVALAEAVLHVLNCDWN